MNATDAAVSPLHLLADDADVPASDLSSLGLPPGSPWTPKLAAI